MSIRVKLYPNYLASVKGAYIAKTENKAILGIEQICAATRKRGGFTGEYEEMVEFVRQFFNETAYQLCDGNAVNTGYYTIYPNVGGMFDSAGENHNKKKNPLIFRFSTLAPLRRLAEQIELDIKEAGSEKAYIDLYVDRDNLQVNSTYTPGHQFSISGNQIKIAGNSPECGVYFIKADDPKKAIKVIQIETNSPSKITGTVPNEVNFSSRIEIRTQYNWSSASNSEKPQVLRGDFILEKA